jgi:hypothetical protein
MFTFLDSRQEDKRRVIYMVGRINEFSLLLINSRMKFWFVTVIPNYLIFATFLKDFISLQV